MVPHRLPHPQEKTILPRRCTVCVGGDRRRCRVALPSHIRIPDDCIACRILAACCVCCGALWTPGADFKCASCRVSLTCRHRCSFAQCLVCRTLLLGSGGYKRTSLRSSSRHSSPAISPRVLPPLARSRSLWMVWSRICAVGLAVCIVFRALCVLCVRVWANASLRLLLRVYVCVPLLNRCALIALLQGILCSRSLRWVGYQHSR